MNRKAWILAVTMVLLFLISISNVASAGLADQPADQQSFIYDVDGNKIYDFDFAKIIDQDSQSTGFSNMTFIFTQCYSGGMLDDLRDYCKGTGDIALLSSCSYDEDSTIKTWKTPNGFSNQESYFTNLIAEGLSLSGDYALTMRELVERAAKRNPCDETYQWSFLGNGSEIRLGTSPTGKSIPANRRFALLFVGKSLDTTWAKCELKHISEVLVDRGFLPDNIVILASNSSGTAPKADGPGTRKALVQALNNIFSEGKMGSDASFFFWTTGHGDWQ